MAAIQTLAVQGCPLAYKIEGHGPPLLMIQGVGALGTGWNPQIAILKDYFTCLTFDNRGIGASQPAGMPLTVNQMAADALALIDHAGWASAHVVGHSLGGLIALQLALNAKSRVRSLSLLCTFARGADGTRMTAAMLWIVLRLRFGTRRLRRQAFLDMVLPLKERHVDPSGVAKRLSAVFGHDIADPAPISSQQLDAMRRHDVTSRLGELAGVPTLVVTGEKDRVAPPSSGRAIAAGIPGARYVEISGAGHAFPVLDAKRCAALLLKHLKTAENRVSATGASG